MVDLPVPREVTPALPRGIRPRLCHLRVRSAHADHHVALRCVCDLDLPVVLLAAAVEARRGGVEYHVRHQAAPRVRVLHRAHCVKILDRDPPRRVLHRPLQPPDRGGLALPKARVEHGRVNRLAWGSVVEQRLHEQVGVDEAARHHLYRQTQPEKSIEAERQTQHAQVLSALRVAAVGRRGRGSPGSIPVAAKGTL
jgi:hypothetical protein